MTPVRVAIAGSTGSNGTQTLDVIEAENDRAPGSYEVAALAAGRSVDVLVDQVLAHRPAVVVVSDPEARPAVAEPRDRSENRKTLSESVLDRISKIPSTEVVRF